MKIIQNMEIQLNKEIEFLKKRKNEIKLKIKNSRIQTKNFRGMSCQ